MSERSSRSPFTPSQLQQLEHQALIYEYMVSGIPIPSDLIIPIRRSFFLDYNTMATSSLTLPSQTLMGWGCFQLGYGSRVEDLEPGRCRRTDGKKWRCSKEACPDSKYCEKHKHRGKNHSRKPVEKSLASTLPPTMVTHPSPISHCLHPTPTLSISTPEAHKHVMYPYSSSKPQPNTPLNYFHLDTAYYSSADKEHRRHHGTKEVDGHCILKDEQVPSEKQQHCLALGVDIKLEKSVKMIRDQEIQKPLHHFFDDNPQKSKDSRMTTKQDEGKPVSNSNSQLSVFTSETYHRFPIIQSRRSSEDEPTLEMHFL